MRYLAIAISIGLVIPPVPARACSCENPSLADAIASHEGVFVVRLGKERETRVCKPHSRECAVESTYDVTVEGVWKGTVAASETIFAGTGTGDCSMGTLAFTHKTRWIVIANRDKNGRFYLRMCSGTRPATDAAIAEVTKLLGAPKPPA